MASPVALVAAVFVFIAATLSPLSVKGTAKFIFEEGYTVTTILDGHKLGFNPYSVLPRSDSDDLIILDSATSTFYTVSFSNSPGVIEKLSGNGISGYSDGDLASAMFNKPRSFAVDMKNNVYVADKKSHTIRKISISGVTTIAGGYTQKTGNTDGPAQNASFSDDFELAFIPQRCALLISDRGNQLVRQINLKAEECTRGSDSVLKMGSMWALALVVACLVGLIVGFAVRPYILPYEGSGSNLPPYNKTWKHYLINLGKQVQTFSFDIRSVTASSNIYKFLNHLFSLTYSHLSLMFGVNLVKRKEVRVYVRQTPFSLLDCDVPVPSSVIPSSESKPIESLTLPYQLGELVSMEGSTKSSDAINEMFEEEEENRERNVGILSDGQGKVDELIQANFMGFAEKGDGTFVAELWEEKPGFALEEI